MHWFTREWWQYLTEPKKVGSPWWGATIWCRLHGHPAGVGWYSGGMEPDMRCKNCRDDLG